jgi:hypothetical protein
MNTIDISFYQNAAKRLNYDPDTGLFTWKCNSIKGRPHKKGEIAGCLDRSGYIRITVRIGKVRKQIRAHRLAWFFYYSKLPTVVDHIDGIKTNNNILNLRQCTLCENQMNRGRQSNNTSGRKGVYQCARSNKWIARIRANKINHHIGSFNTIDEAGKAYDKKAKELFGEFYSGK